MIEMEPKGITSVLDEAVRMTASLDLTQFVSLYSNNTLAAYIRGYARELESAVSTIRIQPFRRRRSIEYIQNMTKMLVYLALLDNNAKVLVIDSVTDGEVYETIMNAIGEIRCSMRNDMLAHTAKPAPAASENTETKED